MGVWNGWGYGIAIFRALNFQISEPEIWQKSLFLRNFRDFPGKFVSEKYFSDSGKWPFHTPPIHTPTKCRPTKGLNLESLERLNFSCVWGWEWVAVEDYCFESTVLEKRTHLETALLSPGDSLSEAFYADTVRRVNLLTLAFALYFPAFERWRSTRSLAQFLTQPFFGPFYARRSCGQAKTYAGYADAAECKFTHLKNLLRQFLRNNLARLK